MSALPIFNAQVRRETPAVGVARKLYQELYTQRPGKAALEASRMYLDESLQQAAALPCDLPDDWWQLEDWMTQRNEKVGQQYRDYLSERQAGAPRRYFSNRSHALFFLQGVAPTKYVDGAWLYGLLRQWWDDRYRALLRIYLEELGDGKASDNHVAMYRRLLAVNGCEHLMPLPDDNYVQGAIQLSLAHLAGHYMPEVVGFNLGYEQLPLHLLITSHELKELGVDPYYFQVHVTVDNAGTGHARKAMESVRALKPIEGDEREYYERVKRGYALNDLGASTLSVIASFDLDHELNRIMVEKSVHGQHMHSDYCRISGRTVNEWLSRPEDVPQFMAELEKRGWITRHADPTQSRFWKLLDGEGADMFGVFSAYERQVIYDWIAGDWRAEGTGREAITQTVDVDRRLARQLTRLAVGNREVSLPTQAEGDFGAELRDFESEVVQARGRHDLMTKLVEKMGPSLHHTPVGLTATRMFSRLLDSA